ncbi:SpaH/EbpB family LPXTG-anchored major pilin [Arcanobacterium hippocoleae]
MSISRPRKLVAALAVFPLLFAGFIGAANAQTAGPGAANTETPTGEWNQHQIDVERKGSITVHKYKNPTKEPGKPTGKEIIFKEGLGEPLDGVKFKITPVKKSNGKKYDFTKDTDILEISKLQASDIVTFSTGEWKEPNRKGGNTKEGVTRSGTHKFDQLPVDVYLVQETESPAGTIQAVPFLAIIPTTDPENLNEWMYDLEVYPKNYTLDVTKSVKDAEKHEGDEITYTVKTDVPVAKEDEDINFYIVKDQLNTNGANTGYNKESVKSVKLIKKDGGQEKKSFTSQNKDYNVQISTGADGVRNHGLTVDFQPKALKEISKLSRNKKEPLQVEVTIALKISKDANKSKGIVNTATLFTKPFNDSNLVKKPSPPVTSYFGKIKLVKHDADKKGLRLQGAAFDIYQCTREDVSNAPKLGKKLFDDQQHRRFVTDQNGEITFPVVHVNNFADNAVVKDSLKSGYCLVETEAPKGYELRQEPVFVNVAKTNASGETIEAKVTVPNVKSFVPKLPLTGGTGIAAIILLAGAIVAIALFWLRKRTSDSQ